MNPFIYFTAILAVVAAGRATGQWLPLLCLLAFVDFLLQRRQAACFANTLGTTNGTIIAQRAMRTLLAMFPMVSKIARNFNSDGKVLWNQTVNAHVVTAAAAAPDWAAATGYVATARTQVDVPVLVNKHIHHTYAVDDQERTSTNINLIDRFAITAAWSIGKRFYDDLFALVTAANYPNALANIGVANFTRDHVVDCGTALNGRDVLPIDRFIVLNSGYAGALFKDRAVVSRDYVDGRPFVTAELGRIHNFDISEYSQLPANAENLSGIAAVPEAFGIATALPEMPQERSGGQLTQVIDQESGLSMLMRQWYDWNLGKELRTYTMMYGVAKGVANNLQRIRF